MPGDSGRKSTFSIGIVTSIHPDFDSRIWKHAKCVAAEGHTVHIVCPWDVKLNETRDGVIFHPFRRVQHRWQRPFLIPLRLLTVLRKLYSDLDIVHFHDIDLLPWMVVTARKMKVIYDVHENYPDEMLIRHWIPKFLRRPLYFAVRSTQRWLSNRIKNLVFVVPSQNDDFDLRRCRRIFIYNYASRELMSAAADDYLRRQPVILFPGAQNQLTGTWPLLLAAKEVCAQHPDVEFRLSDRFTSRQFRDKVVCQIREWRLEDRIKLLPTIPSYRMPEMLNAATIGVVPDERLPQQTKAIPRKLFEYMAAGLPIVVSDLPFLESVVNEHHCGLTARPEEPATFAEAILKLLRDPQLAADMGRAGQRAFESHFSWESQIPRLMEFYEDIITDVAHEPVVTV